MKANEITHVPRSSDCYLGEDECIHIRVHTTHLCCDEITVVYGDKYRWDLAERRQMECRCSTDLHDLYKVKLPYVERLVYYFILKKGGEVWYLTGNGIVDRLDPDRIEFCWFIYPFVDKTKIHRIPSWAKSTVFYQIFPDRFQNGDISNDPPDVRPWGEDPTWYSFSGGDLEGIRQKLGYLHELGIGGIYLTPIFSSPSPHKYNTTDYSEIDSHFGSRETLQSLVKECHALGIKVVLDAVLNHCGSDNPMFIDARDKGENSEYYDWFHFDRDKGCYKTFSFDKSMPKFNTSNAEVQDYLISVITKWTVDMELDGWRLDVSDEIDRSFLRRLRKELKSISNDLIIIGEVWYKSPEWLSGDMFDSVMNYPLLHSAELFFAEGKIGSRQFIDMTNMILNSYSDQVNLSNFNMLDSHDTARFLTCASEDRSRLINALIFIFTFPGMPCIYYGTEAAMSGGNDPLNRRTMDWDHKDDEMIGYIKKLASLKKLTLFSEGELNWLGSTDTVLRFERKTADSRAEVIINTSAEYVEYVSCAPCGLVDVLSRKEYRSAGDNKAQVTVPGRGSVILIDKNKYNTWENLL